MPKNKETLKFHFLFFKKRFTSKGFISPINLIGVTFLIISLFVGIVAVTKKDSNFDIRKLANPIEDVIIKKTPTPTIVAKGTAKVGTATSTPTVTPKRTTTPRPTSSPVCSSGSTCRYGLTDCGSGYEKTGTCSGGVCCKAQSTTDTTSSCQSDSDCSSGYFCQSGVCKKTAQGTANVGTATVIPTPIAVGTAGVGVTPTPTITSSSCQTNDDCNTGYYCQGGECKKEVVTTTSTSSTCSSGSTCRYGLTDCGSGYEKTGTCSGGVCCKAQSTDNKVAEGTANVGINTPLPTTSSTTNDEDKTIADLYTFSTGKKTDSIIDQKIEEIISSNLEEKSCNVSSSFGECGQSGCKENQVLKTWIASDCSKTSVCVYSSDCESTKLADNIVESDSKVVDVGAGFNISQWFSENVIDKILSLFKTKDELEKQVTPTPIAQGTANVGVVTTNEAFCDPNLEKDCLYSCEPTFDGGKCKKKSSIVSEEVVENQTSVIDNQGLISEKVLEKFELSSLIDGKKSCSNNYKAGQIVIWSGYVQGCDGATGEWVNLSSKGYGPEVLTVVPSWLTPESNTWKSLIDASKLAPSYVNSDGEFVEPEKEKWCNTDSGGVPSGTVSLGGLGVRSRCNNGEWKACSNDPNDVSNYCSLTLVPSYIKNSKEELEKLENETQIYEQNISNYLVLYQEKYQECNKSNANECLSEANQFLVNEGLSKEIAETIQNQFINQMTVYANLTPVLEDYQDCLSIKSESECVDERALVTKVAGFTNVDTNLLVQSTSEYISTEYQDLVSQYIDLKFKVINCSNSEGSLKNFSSECKNILNKLTQIERNPIFKYFEARDKMVNCNSFEECKYWEEQMSKVSEDEIFGNVSDFELIAKNYLSPERIFEQAATKNLYIQKAVQALYFNDDYALREACLMENLSSPNKCLGNLDTYKNSVLEQLTDEEKNIIQEYQEKYTYLDENIKSQISSVPYTACTRSGGYYSASTLSCSKGYSCLSGFCVPDKGTETEELTLSESERQNLLSEVSSKQSYCNSVLPGSLYERTTNLCVLETSNVPKVVSIGREVTNSYNCSKSEYFYNNRCYLKEEAAYDLLVGTSGFGNFVEKYEEKLAKCRDEAINNGKVACEGDTYNFKSFNTNQNLLIQEELSLEVDPNDRLNWYGENTSLLLEIAKIAAIKDIKGDGALSEYYLEGEGVIDDEKLIEEGILDQVEEKAWVYLKANVRNTSTTVFGFKLDDGYSIADDVAVNVSYLEKYSEENGLNFAELVSLNYNSSFNVDENNNLVKTGVVLEEMSGSLIERMGANLINQGKLNEAQSEMAADWFDSLVNPDNPEYIYNQVYGNGVNSISSSLSLAGEGIDFTTSYSDWIKENPVRETLFDYASESSFEYAQTVKNNSGYRFASTAETVGAVVIGMVSGVIKPAGPTGFAIGTAIEVGGDLVLHGIVDASTQNTKERFVEKLNADENINQSVIAQVNSSIFVSKVGEYVQVAIFDMVANAAGETLSKFVAGKGIVNRFEDSLVFSIGKKVDPSVVYSFGDEVWDSSRVLVQNELGEIVEVSSKEEALELLSKNYANWTIADNVVQSNAKDLLISAKNSNLGSIFTSYSEKKIVQNISEELTSNQRVIFETLSNVDEVLSGSEKSILRTWIDNRNALRAPTEETLKAGQDIALKGEYNIKLQNGLSVDPQKAANEGLNITIVSGSKVKFSGSALDYLEAINTGKLVLSADDLIEFGAEVAVKNQVGEELSESALKSFSGIESISYPNYVRLANGDKIILGASSDDIKLEGVKAGNVVEIVRDGKLTKGVVGIQGDVSELTGFSAFAVSNQKGLRLAAGIDIDSGKFEFTSWVKNGVFADDVPLGKLANQVDELFESGEKKALTKEVKLIREYHSEGLIDYEYNIVKNADGEEIGITGFKIKVSDEIDSADRELILQRASKIEKSSEELVVKYDAVMRSSNKMSPITEVELKNGTVLTKALDESDSDFAYRIANLRIESPDDFVDAKIITKSGKDTNFFSWRIDEVGDTIQPDVILDAVLTPGTKIIGAPTGLGKSIVAIENIAILKKEILGSDTKITVILKNSEDLNAFRTVFDDRAAEFFGFKAYVMDKIPPNASDLAIIEEANFFVGTSDTIFNSLEDSGMGNKLVQAFKGSILIGDEGHISLRSDVDYIKSIGGSLVIEPTRVGRFQELFDPDDGLLRELTNGHLEDLRLNQKSSQIVDILDIDGNVIKEGFSDEVREKAYRVMIESRLKDFSDVPELKVLLESDDLVTSLEEFLNVPRVTDSKISEVIQALSEDISALNSVEKVLIDVPVNGYDFVENAKTFVDKNGVGDKISAVVPKENNVPTGRQYSQIDDELAYQYLGRKFLGIPVDDIGELNLFVTPDSIGTNYGRFLKETFNLDESVVLTATPGKIQNQWLNRFGISTSLYGTTKQDIPERLLTNLQENFVSFKSLDEIEVSDVLKVGDDSPSVYVIGANKTNNNEIVARIQRKSTGNGRDLAVISGSGDSYLYKVNGEKLLIPDGLIGIETLENAYKEEGEVLDIVYELGRNYATDLNTLPESRFITLFDNSSDVTDFVQTIGRDRCKGGCRELAIVFLGDQEISSDTFLELITKNEANNLAKISVSDVDGEIKNAGYRFIQRLQELDNQKGLGNLFRGENSYDEIYRKWRLTSDLDTTVKATGVTPEEYIVQQTNRLQSFINELYEDTTFRNSLSKKAQEFLTESYGDLFNASDISLLTVAKNVDNLSPLSNSVNAKELIESVNSTFAASDFPEHVVSKNLSSGQVKVLQDVQSEVQESLAEEQSKKTTASKVQDTLNKIKVNTKTISSNISNTVGNIPILKTTRDFIVLGPKGWINAIGNTKVAESIRSLFSKKDSELEKELIIDESSNNVTDALFERGKIINIMAHGIEEEKGGLDNLVNIMTQGIIGNKEENGVFTGQLSKGDSKNLSGPHGPYYVVLAIRGEDLPEQVEIENGIGYKPETHKAYLVPDIESKNEVIEKLENLEKSNQIDSNTKEQLLEKLFTYEEYLALGETQPTQEEITKVEKEAKATNEINKLKEKYEREFDEKNNIQYLGYSTDSYLSQKGITSSRPSGEQSLFMRIESSLMGNEVTISLINIDSDSGVEIKVDDKTTNMDVTDKVSIKVGQKIELGSFSFTFVGTENSTGLERVKLQILGSSDSIKATDKGIEVKKDFFLVGLIKGLFKGIQKGFSFVFDKVINLVKPETRQKVINVGSSFVKEERKVEIKLNLISRVLLKFDEFQNKDKGLYKIINAKPLKLRWIISRTLLPEIFGYYDLTRLGVNFAIKILKIKPQETIINIGGETEQTIFEEDKFIVVPNDLLFLPAPGQTSVPEKSLLAEQQEKLKFALDEIEKQAEERRSTETIISEIIRNIRIRSRYKGVLNIIPPLEYLLDFNLLTQNYYLLTAPSQEEYIKTLKESKVLLEEAEKQIEEVQKKDYEDYLNEISTLERGQLEDQRLQEYLDAIEKISEARRKLESFIKENPVLFKILDDSVKLLPASDEYYDLIEKANQESIQKAEEMKQNALKEHEDLLEQVKKLSIDLKQSPFEVPKDIGRLATESIQSLNAQIKSYIAEVNKLREESKILENIEEGVSRKLASEWQDLWLGKFDDFVIKNEEKIKNSLSEYNYPETRINEATKRVAAKTYEYVKEEIQSYLQEEKRFDLINSVNLGTDIKYKELGNQEINISQILDAPNITDWSSITLKSFSNNRWESLFEFIQQTKDSEIDENDPSLSIELRHLGGGVYEVITGTYRVMAAKAAGVKTITAKVYEFEDTLVLREPWNYINDTKGDRVSKAKNVITEAREYVSLLPEFDTGKYQQPIEDFDDSTNQEEVIQAIKNIINDLSNTINKKITSALDGEYQKVNEKTDLETKEKLRSIIITYIRKYILYLKDSKYISNEIRNSLLKSDLLKKDPNLIDQYSGIIEEILISETDKFVASQISPDYLAIKVTSDAKTKGSTVAVGDVHGDWNALVRVLSGQERTKEGKVVQKVLLDKNGNWIGRENDQLILTGDLFDRAPKGVLSSQTVEKIMNLQKKAGNLPNGQPRIVILVGNHDVNAILAYWRMFRSIKSGNSLRDAAEEVSINMEMRPSISTEDLLYLYQHSDLAKWVMNLPAIFVKDENIYMHSDNRRYLEYGRSVNEINKNIDNLLNDSSTIAFSIRVTGIDGIERSKTLVHLMEDLTERRQLSSSIVSKYLQVFEGKRIIHGHSQGDVPEDSRVTNIDGGLSEGYAKLGLNRARFFEYEDQGKTKLVVEKLKASPQIPVINISEEYLNKLNQIGEKSSVNEKDTASVIEEERQKLINEYEEALKKCRELDSSLDDIIVLKNIEEQPNSRISYQINLINEEITKLEELKDKWEKAKTDYLNALETLEAISPDDVLLNKIDYEKIPYRDYDSIEAATKLIVKKISTDRKDILINQFKNDLNALKVLNSPFLNNLVVSDITKNLSGGTAAVYSVITFDKEKQVTKKIIAKVYFDVEERALKEQKAFDLVSDALHNGEYSLSKEVSYVPEFYHFDEANKILFMEYAKEIMDLTKPVDLAYLVQLAHFGYLLRQSGVVPKDYKFNDNLYINNQQLKVIDIGLYDNSLDGQESHYRNFIKDFGDLLGTYTGVSYFEFQNELSQKTDEEVVKIVNSKNIPNWTKYLILFSRGLIKGQTDQSSIEGYKEMLFDIVTVAKENGVSEDQIPESLREIYNNKEEINKNNDKFNSQGGTSVKSEVIKQTNKKVGNTIKRTSNFGKTLFSILISGSIIFTILGTLFGFNFLSIPKTDISINEPVSIVSEVKVQKDSSSLNSSESQRYEGIQSLNKNNVVNVSFSSEGQVSYNFESYSDPYTLIPDYYYDEILLNIVNSDDFCSNVDSCKLKLKQIPIISHINDRVQVDSDFGENLSFIELNDDFTWFPTTNWNSNSKVRSDVADEVKSFLTQVTSLDSNYYVKVRYGYRSYSEQKLAYDKANTGDVARQGFSQHQSGLAIDLDTNVPLDELTTIANKNGFVHPFTVESGWSDPPHWFYLDGIYTGLTQMIIDAGQNPNDINVINEVLLGLSQTYEAKIRLLEEPNSSQNVVDVSQESKESTILLSETAKKYITNSQKQTTQVSAELLTVNNSDGSVVCGPLAASLMKDGGYLDSTTDVHDFFLLNDYADQGLIFLKKILPEEKYEWFRTSTSVANFDFSLYPLQPGDLLYLKGGTFTHWLTITRIDEEGKIYAVTNITAGYINGNKNDDSFLIQEIMLYDPKNPEDGQFAKWTSYDYPKLGRTGTEGFRLWRLKGEGKSNNFSVVYLNSSLIPFLNAQTFQKISEKYIYSKWSEMEEKGVLPVLYQKIKEKIINSKNVASNIESDEDISTEPTIKEQILASSLVIAKEYKPNSCSDCGTLLNDLDTQLQLFRNAKTGKEQLESLKKARELLSNHAIDNQVIYASGQLLTDAEIYSTFRVNHDEFRDSVRLLIKNIDRAMNEDLLVEIKKLLILLKSRLVEMQVRFNLEDIDLEDDEVKRMIKYITGVDYVPGKEYILRDRLLEDHDIVKNKYNLPDSKLRSDSPSEYISKLEEIGKKYGISIRNSYEMEVFFRGNEQIKAVFMEKSNEIYVPLVNKNNYDELIGYAENLEHELIHALQHKYYPKLPVEAMEYEAYIGANVSIEYLKKFPLDSIEKDFFTIKSSIEYWYESNELIAPWSNEAKKADDIDEKTNETNEIIPVTGQGQIKEVIFKDQINTAELKKKFEEGFFKGLLTKDGIFVVGFSRHDVIADWIDEKFPEYKNDPDSIIAAYDSGRIILMPTSKEINFEVFLPDFASDLLSMGISDGIECEVIGGVIPFMGLIEYDAKLKDISEGINFERIKSNIVINGYLGEEAYFNSKFTPVTYQIVIGNKFESDKYGQFMISNFSKKSGLYYIKFENRDNEIWTERKMIAEFGEGKIEKIGSRQEDSSVNVNYFDELKKQFISTLYNDVRIRGFLTDKNQVYWTTKNVYLEQLKINSVLLNREVMADFEYSPTGQIFYVNGSSSGVSKLMYEFIKAGVGKDMSIFATVDGVNLSKLGIKSISDLAIYLEDQKVVN